LGRVGGTKEVDGRPLGVGT
jgi:hypothetical protein